MKVINITSGEYLNNYLINKNSGIYIPFNEAMIQGELIYPLFDNNFISKRSRIHNVDESLYKEKINDFINIKNYINDISKITLWFGKDAFCIINLLTVLSYLEDNNYNGKIILNLVDDYSHEVIEGNIELILGEFKNIYIKLMNNKHIKCTYNFINEGIKDYIYITSDDNHILNYIKENINKLTYNDLMIKLLDLTSGYGLSDIQIKSMIEKAKK